MLDLLVSWIADAIAEFMEIAVSMLSSVLGFDITMFNETFPFALVAYEIFQYTSLVIIVLIAGFQLWPWFFPSDRRNKANPLQIAFGAVIATFFVFYGNYIFMGIINLCNYPYMALLDSEAAVLGGQIQFGSVASVVETAFYQTSILLYIVVLLLIGIAFLKLLLESIERYVVLFLIVYASPLAASTLASPSTAQIFKKFFAMFISQCVLVVLNIWILKLVISMFSNLGASSAKILALLLGYAVLRVGARLDSYLNQLGLNAAITGVGLAGELMGAGLMMASMSKGGGGILGGGGSGGGSGGVFGFAQKAAQTFGKYSPGAMVADGAKNLGSAVLKSAGQGIGAAKDAIKGGQSGSSVISAAINTAKTKMPANAKAAIHKTADSSIYARKATQGIRENIGNSFRNHRPFDAADQEAVAKHAHIADSAFEMLEGTSDYTRYTADVSAVMQGIGMESVGSEASEFIGAGYGKVPATKVDFMMDKDGISASYEKDNVLHNAEVISGKNYNQLSPRQQHGFTEFKSGDGKTYHARFTSERVPPPPPPPKPKSRRGRRP